MSSAPIPADEAQRLADLHSLNILDTPPEERFDRITRITRRVFNPSIVTVSLIDANRQWFKSCIGLPGKEIDRHVSFCAYTILGNDPLIIPDATLDPRFADNELVTGETHVRSYAGMPLIGPHGSKVGTLCVVGKERRQFTDEDLQSLKDLAAWAEIELNTHDLTQALSDRDKAMRDLQSSSADLERLNKTMIGREIAMKELKDEIRALREQAGMK